MSNTINRLIRGARRKWLHKSNVKTTYKGVARPFISAVITSVTTRTPKKPNSAIRKVAIVKTSDGRKLISYIPGEKHNFKENMKVLIEGGRVKDLIGVRSIVKRNGQDGTGVQGRKTARSKYGVALERSKPS